MHISNPREFLSYLGFSSNGGNFADFLLAECVDDRTLTNVRVAYKSNTRYGREGGREGSEGREGKDGREGRRERGRREGGKEGRKGKEGEREEGGREGGKEGRGRSKRGNREREEGEKHAVLLHTKYVVGYPMHGTP